MFRKSIVLLAYFLASYGGALAQGEIVLKNNLTLSGGISYFDLRTGNLETKPNLGYLFGLSMRQSLVSRFDVVYGFNFHSSVLAVRGQETQYLQDEEIEYTVQGLQLKGLACYNIFPGHLSVDVGPIFQFNGKMNINARQDDKVLLAGTKGVLAEEIQDVSKFDFRMSAGITGGLSDYRLSVQYQYGLGNFLEPLNKKFPENNFKGNTSTFIVAFFLYF